MPPICRGLTSPYRPTNSRRRSNSKNRCRRLTRKSTSRNGSRAAARRKSYRTASQPRRSLKRNWSSKSNRSTPIAPRCWSASGAGPRRWDWRRTGSPGRSVCERRHSRERRRARSSHAQRHGRPWRFVGGDRYRAAARAGRFAGSARAGDFAFRLLLTTDGALPPPYAALLKHDALAAAKNLATAHRRLIAAIGQLNDQNPKVLADALSAGDHPVVFWGLTLLYNARREPITAPIRPKREYGPLAVPAANTWRQAWTVALALDEPSVTQLLVACFKDHPEPTKRDPRLCQFPFHCPLDWRARTSGILNVWTKSDWSAFRVRGRAPFSAG